MLALVLAGAALRLAYVNRPLDYRMLAPWRESDYTQLARNYWREDPNLFHPRIDWRRDGPGLVEMEFPLLPWTAGMLCHLLGYHEAMLRGLSAILEIGSLLVFAGLCAGGCALDAGDPGDTAKACPAGLPGFRASSRPRIQKRQQTPGTVRPYPEPSKNLDSASHGTILGLGQKGSSYPLLWLAFSCFEEDLACS